MNLNQLFSLTILKKRQKTCQTYLVTLVQISHELKKPFCTSLLELLKLVNLIFYVHTQVACTCYGPPMSLHLTGYEPKLINWLDCSKKITQNLSNIYGHRYANKWRVVKDFVYKSTRTCKINPFYTHQHKCTCYGQPM